MIAIEIFYNMALCFQKLGQLDECALCLETCLDHLGKEGLNLSDKSIAMRLIRLKLECKVRMQHCAILSQLHRHKDALNQAYESAKICNVIAADQVAICDLLSKRVQFQQKRNKKVSQMDVPQGSNQEESGDAVIMPSEVLDNQKLSEEEIGDSEDENVEEYRTYQGFINNLEDSISFVEKSAKNVLPIFKEVIRRAV